MLIRTTLTKVIITFAALAALLLGMVFPAGQRVEAQCPPDATSFGIYQNDKLVGEIYRQDPSPANYVEHWVLFPDYVYPSTRNGMDMEIRPGQAAYQDEKEFFAKVSFAKGSRYVRVDCADGMTLPGRADIKNSKI